MAVLSFGWSFAFAQGVNKPPSQQAPAVAPQEGASVPEPAVAQAVAQQAAPAQEEQKLKDPFESYLPNQEKPEEVSPSAGKAGVAEETFDTSSLQVTGLVWGTENPKAIINGNVVGKGDVVNGGEIIDISKEGILFKYKEKEYLMKRQSAVTNPEQGQKEQGGKK